ncbi:MAG: ROK family transcriptional regulator [Anaerolineae bacterium]
MVSLTELSQPELEILAALRRSPVTRLQLAEHFGRSPSSLSRLLGPMLQQKLILEMDGSSTRGVGRPALILQANPAIAYGIGIDIGAMNSRFVVTDFCGNIISKHIEPTRQFRDNRDFGDYATDLGARALASIYSRRKQVVGIVAAVSGVVDSNKGICLFCPNIRGPIDIPAANILMHSLGYPTRIEDPARMQALAEGYYGVAKGANDYLYIHIGIGVGSGIVLAGRMLHGSIGIAGEIGHILVGEDGPRCNCGNRGCLEAYVSGPALVRKAREGLEHGIYSSLSNVAGRNYAGLTVEVINDAAQHGDKMAFHIIDEAGEHLGIAIATAVNLLGCPLVIIGGGVANLCDVFYQAAERAMRSRALPMVSPYVSIKRSALDTFSAAWGAATAAIDAALPTA